GDEGRLHGLPQPEVEGAVLLRRGRDEVRDGHDRDVLGDREAVDARARGLGAGELAARDGHGDGGGLLERVRAGLEEVELRGEVDVLGEVDLDLDAGRRGVDDARDATG